VAPEEPAQPQPTRLNRRQLEQLQAESWHEAHNADQPMEARCHGLLQVIEFFYWRSLESWEIARRIRWTMGAHGNFSEFVASWLWSNGYRTDPAFAGLGPILEALRQEYPAPARPMIGEGRSYWGTGDDHRRRSRHNSPPGGAHM
jgi:hypothetical protein